MADENLASDLRDEEAYVLDEAVVGEILAAVEAGDTARLTALRNRFNALGTAEIIRVA